MQIMKRLLIKNKRKLWLWFLLLVFLFLACRAAYITGSKAEQTRNNEVEERQADSRSIPNEMEILCLINFQEQSFFWEKKQ